MQSQRGSVTQLDKEATAICFGSSLHPFCSQFLLPIPPGFLHLPIHSPLYFFSFLSFLPSFLLFLIHIFFQLAQAFQLLSSSFFWSFPILFHTQCTSLHFVITTFFLTWLFWAISSPCSLSHTLQLPMGSSSPGGDEWVLYYIDQRRKHDNLGDCRQEFPWTPKRIECYLRWAGAPCHRKASSQNLAYAVFYFSLFCIWRSRLNQRLFKVLLWFVAVLI